MAGLNVHFRHVMLFYFRRGKTVTQVVTKICKVYGREAVTDKTVRKWFVRFGNGDIDVSDRHRPGRPVKVDRAALTRMVKQNPHLSLREMAARIGVPYTSVQRHLRAEGFVNKLDVWLPKHSTIEEQQDVVRFLTAEGVQPADIHRRMVAVYGEDCMSDKSVRKWNACFHEDRDGLASADDDPRTGGQASTTKSSTAQNKGEGMSDKDAANQQEDALSTEDETLNKGDSETRKRLTRLLSKLHVNTNAMGGPLPEPYTQRRTARRKAPEEAAGQGGNPGSSATLTGGTATASKVDKGKMFDSRGVHTRSGIDLCDCLNSRCPGCFFPCQRCSNTKCGPDCRSNRNFLYESWVTDGDPDSLITNPLIGIL